MQQTEILTPDKQGIARAAELLHEGRLVAFPTETVYGLGADACNGRAVAAVFEAKDRPRFNPLIVHVSDVEAAIRLVRLNKTALRLAKAFWPGPLTIVAQRRADAGIASLATAGLRTLAVRVPAHPLARALLAAVGHPVAAPSANASGSISPTTAAHVVASLGSRIAAVLDGGTCEVGLESTIIGFEGGDPVVLRPGGISAEAIEEALGQKLAESKDSGITAPGQLESHYAPGAELRMDAPRPGLGEAWLGFGLDPEGVAEPRLNLSPEGNIVEAAANLFAYLHQLDAMLGGRGTIAVAPIPGHGLGRAINDRLARASAPR